MVLFSSPDGVTMQQSIAVCQGTSNYQFSVSAFNPDQGVTSTCSITICINDSCNVGNFLYADFWRSISTGNIAVTPGETVTVYLNLQSLTGSDCLIDLSNLNAE
jgi:hypothetical protein